MSNTGPQPMPDHAHQTSIQRQRLEGIASGLAEAGLPVQSSLVLAAADDLDDLRAEIERLRAALTKIAAADDPRHPWRLNDIEPGTVAREALGL